MFKKKVKNSASKIDNIVTWVIIWTAVASVVWLSQTKKWKEVTAEIKQKSTWVFGKLKQFYWKSMIFFIKKFSKKK